MGTLPHLNTFSRVIREARWRLGLTQSKLAIACDITDVYVSQIENGRRIPRPQICVALAHALELDPKELLRLAQSLANPVLTDQLLSTKPLQIMSHQVLWDLLKELEDAGLPKEKFAALVEAWSQMLHVVKQK